jgi:hypothetical protein
LFEENVAWQPLSVGNEGMDSEAILNKMEEQRPQPITDDEMGRKK